MGMNLKTGKEWKGGLKGFLSAGVLSLSICLMSLEIVMLGTVHIIEKVRLKRIGETYAQSHLEKMYLQTQNYIFADGNYMDPDFPVLQGRGDYHVRVSGNGRILTLVIEGEEVECIEAQGDSY